MSLLRSNPHVILCTVDEITYSPGQPFSGTNKVVAQAVDVCTLYGANRPPKNAALINNQPGSGLFGATGLPKHIRLIGDGTKTDWHQDDYPELANLNDDGGTLDNTNRLLTVVFVNGRGIQRVQSDGTADDGNFLAVDDTGMNLHTEKTGGGAYGNGTVIDVYMLETGDVVSQALLGGVLQEVTAYDLMCADSESITLTADRV